MRQNQLDIALRQLAEGAHGDPFAWLGRHPAGDGHGHANSREVCVRVILPRAETVTIAEGNHAMTRIEGTDLFEWRGPAEAVPERYRLIWRDDDHREHIGHDPYAFAPQLPDFDMHLFGEGRHWHAYRLLGAHVHETDGIAGVVFSVWAPNASRVSVVGDFNHWDGRCHPMRRHGNGVWELFIPDLPPGVLYKFEIRTADGALLLKSDPYGRRFEVRPSTASIVEPPSRFRWNDDAWLKQRAGHDWQHSPMSIYEVHLGSWQRGPEGEMLNYRELGERLVAYVRDLGFTHIELMPVTEHPFDLSWGYQTTGYYAPTSRFGSPDDFRWLVDHCHANGIGVILDWVPAHFPKDAHGLGRFDGTALFEHEDPRLGEHLDWSTLIFNFGRNEVKNFLVSSALYWLEEFHIDGLRVDAVASMLYLDYSRTDWLPNRYGGRENLEAIDFLRELNEVLHDQVPGALVMAEESTSWPQVTRPTYVGGLGFDLKWNMGWMNDTLEYFKNDPIHRQYHQDALTFSMVYAFSENFLLPFSHDEVTHGKRSLLYRMPGDEWQRFANLRLLYAYMYTHPGKKLLFMGSEFGQGDEWDSTRVLDWYVLEYPFHQGIRALVQALNALYRAEPPLHGRDFDDQGFEWIDCHDAHNSVLVFQRRLPADTAAPAIESAPETTLDADPDADTGSRTTATDDHVLVVLNFTPVPRQDYRVGTPGTGAYREIFNSDATEFGGSGLGNSGVPLQTEPVHWMNRPNSLRLTLPPLAGVILKPLTAEPAAAPDAVDAADIKGSDPEDANLHRAAAGHGTPSE
ncbi:1,4-alpha-glucan branching protein GlgB [Thiohalocapsa marina]|uniref:1,4-alpha-glucan branching enzyme GlgB n=1 Tax=Thiohalocapsa marina TaxID=424902 RepID=A0A5M8FQU3_9GAMM|nr:1,4-alpha-glucan branching protein GlgB [Thiohalocapsa marina]KAA6186286.1 1,4-alpha-glucan branching protein GlgB [Thiohalocapsa marina]